MTEPVVGIRAIRRALQLGDDDEALVHAAARRLVAEVDGWVDRFYARITSDPGAAAMLHDAAVVVRLRHTLCAWAHEWLTLPYDEPYERARAEIGRAHVRIGLPQHLMVTSMGSLRRDVVASVERLWAAGSSARDAVRRAVTKVLDLELALMLGQFERRTREVERDRSRSEDVRRFGRRVEKTIGDGVSAALCYAHLVRASGDAEQRSTWLSHLEGALKGLLATVRRAAPPLEEEPVGRFALGDLAASALADVSLAARTVATVAVEPPDLEVVARPAALHRALVELLQNAANHDPGGTVRLRSRADTDGSVVVEVTDGGPGWPPDVVGSDELGAGRGGVGLSVAADVAETHGGRLELFAAPGGGAGARLRLPRAGGRKDAS